VSSDQHFSLTTRIARSADEVFAWHEQPGALERLCPPWEKIEVGASSNGIHDGAIVSVRTKLGPVWFNWKVEHRDYVQGRQFRDVQLSGPFARWEHLHRIDPDGPDACQLTDEITFRLPGGKLGRPIAGGCAHRQLSRLFAWRHATTKSDLERQPRYDRTGVRRIVIAGASGLIGQTLVPFLRTQGHSVVQLVRRPVKREDELYWNPGSGELDLGRIDHVDAIINLSGENVGGGRWTAAKREAIFRSRVDATRTLVDAIKQMQPRPSVFVSVSAVGFYGDRGDEILTEHSGIGRGFLAEVCLAWETHAEVARTFGVRTVMPRLGVVLTPAGGALAKLLPVFRAGLGGRVGGGKQWMSWIGIDDAIDGIHHAVLCPEAEGPMNLTSPNLVTNREFTAVLARVLRRPAVLPVPCVVLRAVFGKMADEAVLTSGRAVPGKLNALGYRFRHPELETALRHVLGRDRQ
jgi:uncharacterized protein (TIGR01777 family)